MYFELEPYTCTFVGDLILWEFHQAIPADIFPYSNPNVAFPHNEIANKRVSVPVLAWIQNKTMFSELAAPVCANLDSNTPVMTSSDGISWSVADIHYKSSASGWQNQAGWYEVAYGNGKYVVTGSHTRGLMTSPAKPGAGSRFELVDGAVSITTLATRMVHSRGLCILDPEFLNDTCIVA